MSTPSAADRYAVVCPNSEGPSVSFWTNHSSIIRLMTTYSNIAWYESQGFSVWHRRTAKSRWVCITN